MFGLLPASYEWHAWEDLWSSIMLDAASSALGVFRIIDIASKILMRSTLRHSQQNLDAITFNRDHFNL